jgi:hypothetical protein
VCLPLQCLACPLQVYALTGGLPHAIMPAVDLSKVKKKAGKAVRWGWLPFTPGSRKDALQLHHWVSAHRGTAQEEHMGQLLCADLGGVVGAPCLMVDIAPLSFVDERLLSPHL